MAHSIACDKIVAPLLVSTRLLLPHTIQKVLQKKCSTRLE